MPQPAEFPREFLGLDGGKGQERLTTKRILELEKASIDARRATTTSSPSGLVGLALSGGGIRSATFCLGVLQVLARQRILDQVDYLSTVSGGGYLGAFLSSRPTADAKALLDNGSDAMRALRQRAHHHLLGEQALKGSLEIAFTWLRGLLLGLLAVYAVLGTAVGLQIAVQESGVPLKRVWFWTGIAIGVPVLFVLSAFVAKRPEGVVHRALRSVLQVLFAAAVLGGFVEFASWFHAWTLRAPFTSSAIGTSTVGLSAIVAFAAKLLRRRWIAALAIEIALTLLVPLALAWTYAELEGVVALADTGVRLRYVAVLVVAFLTTAFVSLNRISPHVFYRSRLVRTYLPEGSDALKLSALAPEASRMPYPIVNATVNLPGSRDLAMRGRKSASFVFTKHCCGSGATGWFATASVEKLDPSLDLGTAMAISGAAASSWMGTVTTARRVPLLTLLNVRLGYWLPNPRRVDGPAQARMQYLWRELSGAMKEDTRFLNVSDGGHIENLGILELLRRRCRFIVAVDAEADDGISCAGLITALRLARVDFDVKVALELDDLVRAKSGTTRKHFAFGLILYPDGPPGYLLYVKASLTGDEERHLVEYRARHPRFPHESTGDQFFDEEQFEAYRSLGEHIAERLFMPPFARSEGNERCDIDAWLDSLREHLLPDDHPDQDLRRRERESPDDQLLATAIDGVRAAGVQMRF
ncbi:MAG: patatin-like phospholipase family protein [Planctomycetes bacterium]|nr:patatin-like phospholipase family protein [Planctomycetota bacterium]